LLCLAAIAKEPDYICYVIRDSGEVVDLTDICSRRNAQSPKLELEFMAIQINNGLVTSGKVTNLSEKTLDVSESLLPAREISTNCC
jgi:hypothetical protein